MVSLIDSTSIILRGPDFNGWTAETKTRITQDRQKHLGSKRLNDYREEPVRHVVVEREGTRRR